MEAGLPAAPESATASPQTMRPDEYRKLAELEDRMWYFRALHRHCQRALTRAGLAGRAADLLDDGCGTGGLLRFFHRAEPGWRLTGIDFSARACALARERCGDFAAITQASALALPFPDASFDAVVSGDVICQLPDPLVAFREMARVLRPGGVAVVNAPAYPWMWSYHDDACESVRRFVRPEIRGHFEHAGLQVEALTHWNALPFPAVWAKRRLLPAVAATSDLRVEAPWLERTLDGVMALERGWLEAGGSWAWGTSIFGLGRKAPA